MHSDGCSGQFCTALLRVVLTSILPKIVLISAQLTKRKIKGVLFIGTQYIFQVQGGAFIFRIEFCKIIARRLTNIIFDYCSNDWTHWTCRTSLDLNRMCILWRWKSTPTRKAKSSAWINIGSGKGSLFSYSPKIPRLANPLPLTILDILNPVYWLLLVKLQVILIRGFRYIMLTYTPTQKRKPMIRTTWNTAE